MRLLTWLFLLLLTQAALSDAAEDVLLSTADKAITIGASYQPARGETRLAMLLLPVAGPTDRDMSLGKKRLYADLAEALAQQGIATLRVDDRGVGTSTGRWQDGSLEDRIDDACAALTWLSERHDVPTGILGMSEGGGVALGVGHRCGGFDVAVLLSTPALDGRTVMRAQMETALAQFIHLEEKTKAEIRLASAEMMQLLAATDEHTASQLEALLSTPAGRMLLPPYQFVPRDLEGQVAFVQSAWFRSQLDYDISPYAAAVNIPVLALYGELDQVIDARLHRDSLQAMLGERLQVTILDGHNHLMQQASTGSPLEYLALPGGISDLVIERVLSWLDSTVLSQ